MKTHERGDQPVRYMANRYVRDIIREASGLLLEMTRPEEDSSQTEYRITQIEELLERVRFNLQKPKPK